jgi:heavy metal response regulator
MRILVIEDEKHIANFIRQGLKENGYSVDTANDGENGYFLISTEKYDTVILDLMIPKMDGITLCKKIRSDGNKTPILILSAKDSVNDKVTGLDCGADDYLTKPFAFEELLARIRVLLRKNSGKESGKLQADDLIMDLHARKVTRSDKEILLTNKEFALLEYLMYNSGQVVTRTAITEHVWDMNFDADTNVVDVHINALRNKIDRQHKKKIIHTVRGSGYIIRS